jgi:hypothetical protein
MFGIDEGRDPAGFWALAMMWSVSVVLPLDSGPKTSRMRPRGDARNRPSAMSRLSEPVAIPSTVGFVRRRRGA